VLKRLSLKLGDMLLVGSSQLRIVDVVVYESDSPVNILSFGPRVFVAAEDADRIDLVKKGSRVEYEMLLKVADQTVVDTLAARLKSVAVAGQERVNSFRDEGSGIKRFFDNLLFFLSLISIFTLLLAGLGMQSCLTALVRQKEKTIAIARTVGASSAFLYRHYLLIVMLLGLLGTIIGVVGGVFLGNYFPYLFDGLLPIQGDTSMRLADLGEGMSLGFVVVLLFTFLPLYRLRNIKPIVIFRNEAGNHARGIVYYIATAVGVAMVTLLVIRHLEDKTVGLMFMAGVLALVAVIAVLAHLLVWGAGKLKFRELSLRQALRSMIRTGNATRSIIITLSSALSLLFAIYLVEHNLKATYIESYPEDAPNLFCIDIQPDQRDGFLAFFDEKPVLFPIIRARLIAINGEAVKREEELQKKRDNFAREFNLTYREDLLEDEVIREGGELYPLKTDGEPALQVSVLDSIADSGGLQMNDTLLFNIQGVELEARITSIRGRTKSMLYPFFYFVFPDKYLSAAPQTFFSAVMVDADKIASLQTRVLQKFPNISFINVTETAQDIDVLMQKLSSIVNFFASFSILAGALILVSSILATRMARIRESVYYKILGGKKAFVYRIFVYENGLIGFFSGLIALLLSHCGSWAICHFLFEIDYSANAAASFVLVLTTVLLVIATGLISSVAIVRQKPARFLREHSND